MKEAGDERQPKCERCVELKGALQELLDGTRGAFDQAGLAKLRAAKERADSVLAKDGEGE